MTRIIKGMGYIPDLGDPVNDYKFTRRATKLPTSWDFRPKAFARYDQGQQGSCTGHGSVTAARMALIFHGLHDYLGSRAAAYYLARLKEGTQNQDSGAMVRDALDAIHNKGFIDEELDPYSDQVFDVAPSTAALASGMKHLGFVYERVNNAIWANIQAAFVQNGNIVYGATLYDSFQSPMTDLTGVIPMPKKGDKVDGGHCFAGSGFQTTAGKEGICTNSWGEAWGAGRTNTKPKPKDVDRGFFLMPKAYLTNTSLVTDCWTWTKTMSA